MRITSHITSSGTEGGWMRYHCHDDRPLNFRGEFGDDAVFVLYSDDGRTYTLTLTKADMAEVAKATR